MKYSVIIPVYNGEAYLDACLTSVLSQYVSDFEVLLVDDGSGEAAARICDRYAARDPRVRVFHRENAGVSAARNFGLDQAAGEYVCFVDADDVVSPSMLSCVDPSLSAYDVLLFRHTRTGKLPTSISTAAITELPQPEVLDCTIYDENARPYNCNTVWAKLFRRETIASIRFLPEMKIGEDKLFNYAVFSRARRIGYADAVVYYCRPNEGSTTRRYAPGYLQTVDRSFRELERLADANGRAAQSKRLLSLRAVAVMRNLIHLELCHPDNPASYREREQLWQTVLETTLLGAYFRACSGIGLSKRDHFFYRAYQHRFSRIDRMTRSRAAKAAEYLLYQLFSGR